MARSWRLWAVFALCLAVLLAGVGAISAAAVRLDRSEAAARRQAAVEEDVRLALWRLDSAVAPLLARESARPYFVYAALYAPERVYTRAPAELSLAEVLVPSPLLTRLPERVLLHFQVGPALRFTLGQISYTIASIGYSNPDPNNDVRVAFTEITATTVRGTFSGTMKSTGRPNLSISGEFFAKRLN